MSVGNLFNSATEWGSNIFYGATETTPLFTPSSECGKTLFDHFSNIPIDQCIAPEKLAFLAENKWAIASAIAVISITTYFFATRNSSYVTINYSDNDLEVYIPIYGKNPGVLTEADQMKITDFKDYYGFTSDQNNPACTSVFREDSLVKGWSFKVSRYVKHRWFTHGQPFDAHQRRIISENLNCFLWEKI